MHRPSCLGTNDTSKQSCGCLHLGVNIDAIHADRTPTQRENAVRSFRRGDTWILICTELMGRGIDFKVYFLHFFLTSCFLGQ